jgi:hypothetical protein
VDAPDGTPAKNSPAPVVIPTSNVGFPRESKISRAPTFCILYLLENIAIFLKFTCEKVIFEYIFKYNFLSESFIKFAPKCNFSRSHLADYREEQP